MLPRGVLHSAGVSAGDLLPFTFIDAPSRGQPCKAPHAARLALDPRARVRCTMQACCTRVQHQTLAVAWRRDAPHLMLSYAIDRTPVVPPARGLNRFIRGTKHC